MMRLVCYPSSIPVQTCGEKYLSTSSWKESVLANITYVQEPEEEYQDPHEFLQFLVTSDRRNPGKIIAHLLKSPSQINGGIAHCLHRQSLLPRKPSLISQEDIAAKLSQMPCLNAETLDWLNQTVEDIQSELLKEWLDEKKAHNVVVELEAVHKFLCEIQELVLRKLGPSFPTKYQMPAQPPEDVVFSTELDLNPSEWPERQYLLHQECQRKGLSRVQSTESLALSSPLQAEEAIPTTIDIKNFTKLFREDGSAASENLSPVRRRHPSRTTGSHISLSVRSDTTSLLWPECRDVRAPDVYYNRDKKCERVAAQCSKIQDRYVKEETYSSCSSPIFFVKKKENKGREVADINLRRSPRKALSKLTSPRARGGLKRIEGKLKSPRKSAGGILKSPLKRMTTHLKSPRKSTGGILKSPLKRVASQLKSPRRSLGSFTQTHSHTTRAPPKGNHMKSPRKSQVTGNETGEVRRSPRKKVSANFASVLQSHGRRQSLPAPGKSTSDKPSSTRRLSSLGGAESGRKESRSERHKRKLEEIVTDVLVQHGIGKGDPLHAPSVQRLYKVTKLFVMDLPTSQNLKQEMRNIAEGQVKQVVDLEKKRLAK
ncbi:hypothetical protein FSP39_006691 [Pinctada imbricata]|uniref:Uncharacterized protein n=1 Tax=Pinctada imbricata TaxID=66713 RepID=A0AA88XI26_PINIB|nr:hypothetical protein FSP39_006691 [Pinctada imbricata]